MPPPFPDNPAVSDAAADDGRARASARASPRRPTRSGASASRALTAVVAAFLFARLTVWPPHEDETLALFTGRGSVGELWRTVLGERGGAPLHFLFAWVIAHTGGGLVELRLVSALFAIASVPLIALLVARLTDRVVALVATAIVVPSWMLLFHGIYGRMYSLFLFTAALSYLALLRALERRDRRGLDALGTRDSRVHRDPPVRRAGGRVAGALRALCAAAARGLPAFVVVGVLAIPFWRSDTVLASRFDVGVGGGGTKLGSPFSILKYLERVAGDFTVGWIGGAGGRAVARARRDSCCSCARSRASARLRRLRARDAVPLLRVTRIGSGTASPESRH